MKGEGYKTPECVRATTLRAVRAQEKIDAKSSQDKKRRQMTLTAVPRVMLRAGFFRCMFFLFSRVLVRRMDDTAAGMPSILVISHTPHLVSALPPTIHPENQNESSELDRSGLHHLDYIKLNFKVYFILKVA